MTKRVDIDWGDLPQRDRAERALRIVQRSDPDAELWLDGDEWVISTKLNTDYLFVRLVHPNGVFFHE